MTVAQIPSLPSSRTTHGDDVRSSDHTAAPQSPAARAVIEAALALGLEDRVSLLESLELSVADEMPPWNPDEFRQRWSQELQRRLDDYDSGREAFYSEEEFRAKSKALLERLR